MGLISVVIPIYNTEKYMKKCIESVLNQTLKNIEIILVNDGSTDNSKEIMEKYQKENPDKIKCVSKKNGGLSDARNFGMKYVTSDYVAFLDSDDYVEPTIYEKMYNKAIEEKADYVECDFIWEYPNKSKNDIGKIYHNKKEMITYGRVVAWNKLIKTEIIKNNNLQFPKGLRYEDVEFFYKLVPYCNKVAFVKEPLIHYVQRSSSISNTQNERTKEIFEVLDNVLKYYKEKNIYDKYKNELEYTYTRLLLCSSLKRMVRIADNDIRKKLINETWEKLNKNFPNWKNNPILKNDRSGKGLYMKSINKFTYKIYCTLLNMF